MKRGINLSNVDVGRFTDERLVPDRLSKRNGLGEEESRLEQLIVRRAIFYGRVGRERNDCCDM